MRRLRSTPAALAFLLLGAVPAASQMQPAHDPPRNLKVLPRDISHEELTRIMRGFTEALGVRCTHCHAVEEGRPMRPEDLAKDDKPAKETARAMMRMTRELNEKYLAPLAEPGGAPAEVRCVTCHRGAPEPRMLQDVLNGVYERDGLDSTLARYRTLRERYYGRFTYDFGDAPLNELASRVSRAGHPDDAMRLLELNAEQNPGSMNARRQLAIATLLQAFRASPEAGASSWTDLRAKYGERLVGEDALLMAGRQLESTGDAAAGIAALALATREFPQSVRARVMLGEAHAARGDRKQAVAAFQRALALEPGNVEIAARLKEIRRGKPAAPR